MGTAGSTEPLDLPDPQTMSPIPPAIPVSANTSFFGFFALLFAGLNAQIKTGDVYLRRRTYLRAQPYKAATASTIVDYELVAYVSGPLLERKGNGFVTKMKLAISGPHLATNVLPSDNVVIDGKEYPIAKLKRTPDAGADIMFWTVEIEFG